MRTTKLLACPGAPKLRIPHGQPQARRLTSKRRTAAEPERTNGPNAQAEAAKHIDVQSRVKQLMADDPETLDRLEKVREAAAAVAAIQAQKADLDRDLTATNYASAWENQDQERRQAQRAAERGADADILRAAETLEKAQAELKDALAEQNRWSSTASDEAERFESAKAGAIAAAGACLGSAPLLLASGSSGLVAAGSLASVTATGLLFGVTYRYAVRNDVGNVQLKGGVLGAFGLARGLAQAEQIFSAGGGSLSVERLATAAAAAGESVLSIGFAAVALELAFQRGFVKRFLRT